MVVSLEFTPENDVLDWANGIISSHPNDRVIILTHYYLELDATVPDETSPIFDTLIDNNPNVILTLSGHVNYPSNIIRKTTLCNAGHTVNQFLINPQYMDKEYGYNQTSMVAMLYFSENGREVDVEYVSTANSTDTSDVLFSAKNQFSFTIPEPDVSLVTKYGTIPEAYSSVTDYPFVIFDNEGEFVDASGYFYESTSSKTSAIYLAKEYLKKNVYDGEKYTGDVYSVTILMRRNVAMDSGESFNNLSQIQGLLTIDLGGYTLSAPNASDKYLFPSEMKQWTDSGDEAVFPTEIAVTNGRINTYYKPLVQFKPNSNATGKTFDYTFSDVDFFVLGSATEFAINHASKDSIALYPSVTFIDCNIDITGASADSITLFPLGNSNTNASVYLNGGKIITGDKAFTMYSKESGDGTFTFGKLDGKYTKLELSAEAIVPTDEYNGLVFVKLTEGTDTVTYGLLPEAVVEFIPQTSITLDSNLILNVYIPENDYLTEITLDGTTHKIADLVAEDSKYHLTVELPAAEAAREITLTVVFGDEATATYTLSTLKYAEKLLASSTSTKEKTLVCDMLAYIKSAYTYFAQTEDEIANAATVGSAIDAIIADNKLTTFEKVDGTTTEMPGQPSAVTFILDSTPRVRFYFAENTDLTAYSFKIGTTVVPYEKASEVISGTTYVCADISLFAYRMIETIDVYEGEAKLGSFHINSYYDFAKAGSDTALADLVEKFYTYCISAKAYRDEIVSPANN